MFKDLLSIVCSFLSMILILAITSATIWPEINQTTVMLPLALSLIVIGIHFCYRNRPSPQGMSAMILWFVLPLYGRGLLALGGVSPADGFHDFMEICMFAMLSCALGLTASYHAGRACICLLIAILLSGCFQSFVMSRALSGPVLIVNFVSLCGGIWIGWQMIRGVFFPNPVRLRYWFCGMIAAGIIVGVWMSRLSFESKQLREPMLLMKQLWLEFPWVGWGRYGMESVLLAAADPRLELTALKPATWNGSYGFFAMFGLSGFLWVLLGMAWIWTRNQFSSKELAMETFKMTQASLLFRSLIGRAATAIALGLSSMLLVGGVIDTEAWITVVLWGVLAVTVYSPSRRQKSYFSLEHWGLWLTGVAAVVPFGMAAFAENSLSKIDVSSPDSFVRSERLLDHQILMAPYLESILMQQATLVYHQMKAGGPTPERYAKIVKLYKKAQALHPFDFTASKKLAQIQLQMGRPKDAIETLLSALQDRPYSLQLFEDIYKIADKFDFHEVAKNIVDRAIKLRPQDGYWHQRRYLQALKRGDRTEMRQALPGAITTDINSPIIIRPWLHSIGFAQSE